MVSSGLPSHSFMTRKEIVPSATWLGESPEEVFSLAYLESCTQFWTNGRGQRGALLWFSGLSHLPNPVGMRYWADTYNTRTSLLCTWSHDPELLLAPQEQFPLFSNRTKGAYRMHGC